MSEPRNNVFLPDLCTTRAVLVVVVASELMAIVISLVAGYFEPFGFERLALTSLFIQWIALHPAALVFQLRRGAPRALTLLFSSAGLEWCKGRAGVLADAVRVKCGAGCGDLGSLLRQIQSGQPAKTATLGLKEQRVIGALRAEMKAAIREAPNWHLQHQHIRGLMYHMDQACRALALQQARQEGGAIVLQNVANCGPALTTVQATQASKARQAFIAATSNRPVVGH